MSFIIYSRSPATIATVIASRISTFFPLQLLLQYLRPQFVTIIPVRSPKSSRTLVRLFITAFVEFDAIDGVSSGVIRLFYVKFPQTRPVLTLSK